MHLLALRVSLGPVEQQGEGSSEGKEEARSEARRDTPRMSFRDSG